MYLDPQHCGKVATILIKFAHILTIYTEIERKDKYTLKKQNYLLKFSKLPFLLKLVLEKFCYQEP